MTKLKCIIDTWNMIEKHNIHGWEQVNDHIIIIPDDEYERLITSVKNKEYIKNLKFNSK